MPRAPKQEPSQDQSLYPALLLFSLFGLSGISVQLWADSFSDAFAVATLSSVLGLTALFSVLFILSYFEEQPTMAGGKTPPKPESRTVRFRSVVAVVVVLSALAFTWQNMTFKLFRSDPVPPVDSPPVQQPSSFVDKITSPLGQMGMAAAVLVILVLSTGTVSKPKKRERQRKKMR